MKKIIILLIALLLITGCTVNYNITISDDLTIIEKATLTGTNDFFANYYKTTKKNVLKSFLNEYQDVLNEKGYSYELIESKIPYINLEKKHQSITDYINNSILFNGYFDQIKYTENGHIKRIETVGFNENNPENPDRFDIKNLEISVNCPYKVRKHNAKKVDKKTNTYYYELGSNKESKILLEFDASKKYNRYEDVIITVLICLLVIVITWIIIYFLNKKKNK